MRRTLSTESFTRLLRSVCWPNHPPWVLLLSVCLTDTSGTSIQCFQVVQTFLLGVQIKLEAFAEGIMTFYIKNISVECIYNVHEPMYMYLVTHRITYCLSGSGKINAFLS